MSTIIAHTFMTLKRRPTLKTAGMLLCAILSDTLNLQGPTTTDWDRLMVINIVGERRFSDSSLPHFQVAALVELAGVEDVQLLATQQFKAKSSELGAMSAYALCNGKIVGVIAAY
jgi:hypothetical protein